MMTSDRGPAEFDEATLRVLLQSAAEDIGASRPAPFNRHRGARTAAVGLRPGRKALHLFAGAAGLAIVAASVAGLAIELSGHHDGGSPIPGGESRVTPTPESTPPFLAPLPTDGPASHYTVLMPAAYGSGAETLATFTLGANEGLGIDYGCLSSDPTATPGFIDTVGGGTSFGSITSSGEGVPHVLSMGGTFDLSNCSDPNGGGGGIETVGGAGGPITLRVNADSSIKWVVRVYEYPSPAPPTPSPTSTAPSTPAPSPPVLTQGPPPASATVLIPATYGSGTQTLPTFTVAPNVTLYVDDACYSTMPSANILTIVGHDPAFDGEQATGQCFGGFGASGGGSSSGGDQRAGGPVTLTVEADPSMKWVILVYEAPVGQLGP
jgi:hypothetical protein